MHPIIDQLFIGLKKKEFDDELKSLISEKFFDEFIQMMYANLNQVKHISYRRKKIQNVLYFKFSFHKKYVSDRSITIPYKFYKPKRYRGNNPYYKKYLQEQEDKKEKIQEICLFDKKIYEMISVAYDLTVQGQEFNKDYYLKTRIISLNFKNKKVESFILSSGAASNLGLRLGLQKYFSSSFIEECLNYKVENQGSLTQW